MFLPVTKQSEEGLDVFLRGVKAAKQHRGGQPDVVLVPSMVPDGPQGREKLDKWFIPLIEEKYGRIVLSYNVEDGDEPPLSESSLVVSEGVEYRAGIALSDRIHGDFIRRSENTYLPILRRIEDLVGSFGETVAHSTIDATKVLSELAASELKTLAFAEENSVDHCRRKVHAALRLQSIDRSRHLVYRRGQRSRGKPGFGCICCPQRIETCNPT